jgi:hypothetical protein
MKDKNPVTTQEMQTAMKIKQWSLRKNQVLPAKLSWIEDVTPLPTSIHQQDVIVINRMQALSAARQVGEFDRTNWSSHWAHGHSSIRAFSLLVCTANYRRSVAFSGEKATHKDAAL